MARSRQATLVGRQSTVKAQPLQGLPPVAAPDARVLILGSMPGAESLRQGQYYANPRNTFWRILHTVLGIDADRCYQEKLDKLRTHHLALWDVLRSCRRHGSADATIRAPQANDFGTFFASHRAVRMVLFNGATAAALFARLVQPDLDTKPQLVTLPSTSPAHAAMPFAAKVQAWQPWLELVRDRQDVPTYAPSLGSRLASAAAPPRNQRSPRGRRM